MKGAKNVWLQVMKYEKTIWFPGWKINHVTMHLKQAIALGPLRWHNARQMSCNKHLSSVTILGSENCQSISLQNLLSASQVFQGLWLITVNWGCKAAAVILPDNCTPYNLPFMSLCPDKAQGYKVKVQSENISASHFSSQPVMMTGWLVSGIVYVLVLISIETILVIAN